MSFFKLTVTLNCDIVIISLIMKGADSSEKEKRSIVYDRNAAVQLL